MSSSTFPMKISEAIGNDHKYLDEIHDRLVKADNTDDKIKWRNMLTWNLARHAVSEELTLYPAMEKYLGEEGKALVKEDIAAHQAVKEDLAVLQSLSPEDSKFRPLLEQLMHDLHTHIQHESEEDMPRLEGKIPLEVSQQIAKEFARTKKIVPTRSHPSAPTSHWAIEGLAGLLIAPVDKLRDLMTSFPDEEGKETEIDWKSML